MRKGFRFFWMVRSKSPMAISAMLLAAGIGEAGPAHSLPEPSPARISVLGAHALLVQPDGDGTNPAIAGPIHTQADGSALLVVVGGYASNASLPSDNYANKWVQQGPGISFHGYDGKFNTAAYVALPARGGEGHRVRLAKDSEATGEITAPLVEIRNAGVLQDMASTYAVPGIVARLGRKLMPARSEVELTSGSVTTTGPATLVAVWWGDAYVYRMTAVPDNGFRVIERFLELPPNSGVQCAVAVRQVDRAGTWQVTWSGTPAQGAILWLFAFQAQR